MVAPLSAAESAAVVATKQYHAELHQVILVLEKPFRLGVRALKNKAYNKPIIYPSEIYPWYSLMVGGSDASKAQYCL
jgi:hypothetical protein